MTCAVSSDRLVEVSDLVKRYPRSPVNAVDGVSFAVQPGETFGLLGPNGAGKTTTIGVLTTRVRPTSGSAHIGGVDVVRDPVEARRQLAVVPQRNNLDRSLSVRDNLIFHAAHHGVPPREREARADELLGQLGLLELTTDPTADGDILAALATLEGVERVERLQSEAEADGPVRVRLYLSSDAAQLVAPAASLLAERGLALSAVKLGAATLEDVFINLTGRTRR